MEPIPNWYRWLLIVIATLIMCACRSPLQDNLRPRLRSMVTGSTVPSDKATPGKSQRAAEHQHARYPGPSGSRRSLRSGQASDIPASSANVTQSRQDFSARTAELAPVIRTNEKGRLQLQKIESILVAPSSTPAPMPAKDQTESESAVYLRVNDRTDEALQVANAQIDSDVDELGSPFTDDPLSPIPSEPPPPAVSDDDSPIQHPDAPKSVVSSSSAVGEPIIDEPVVVGEPMIVGEPITIGEPIIVSNGAGIAELCPSDVSVGVTTPDCWVPLPAEPNLARQYPDEYICDGGDALSSVHVRNDWSLQGLDPEDTVGHYDKLDGGLVVEPSNRVCIYAPRFAAVRKVTGPYEDEKYLQVQLAQRDLLAVTDEAEQIADQFHQNLAAQGHLGLQPPAGVKSRQPGVESRQSQALHSLDKDLPVHENLLVMKYGVHKQSEKARLAEFTAKAIAWSHDKAVQVVIDEVAAQTRVTRQGTDEIFSIGDAGPAKFRVIKTASVSDALPGEEVEFTLRFDNIGYQPIGNVTIVDNLTTRLEYIVDSQLCSLDAEFVNDENQVDSLTLRWEIRDPIGPGKGGLIRFRCRVR